MSILQPSKAVRWAAAGLHTTGLTHGLAAVAAYARRTPVFQILTYHRVNDNQDPFFPCVPTTVFEQQMAHIAGTYRVLTVEDLADRLRRGGLPRNALAITFDDGYRDVLTHVAPILVRYRLPATIFLATGFIGTADVPWFDRLALAVKTTAVDSMLAPWDKTLSLSGRAERLRTLDRMLAYLKRVADDERRKIVDGLLRALAVTDETCFKDLMLTWDDVYALRGLGFSIGAHTVNHPILSRVSPQRAWTEIVGAKTMIESVCGQVPRAFAYPNGGPEDYTETVKHLVREAGFTCAVTTRFGVNTPRTAPYELRRGGPWEEDLPTFALKLTWYRLFGN